MNEFYVGMEDGCKETAINKTMSVEQRTAASTFCSCIANNLKSTLTTEDIEQVAQLVNKKDSSGIEKFVGEKITIILPKCMPEEEASKEE